MSHRINVILDDEIWATLKKVRRGDRSRFINQAVGKELLRTRREAAVGKLEEFRRQLPSLEGHAEQWLREDRDSH